MDMMEIGRRMVQIMASGSGAQVKTGTFIGDGTTTKEIACSFYPDIIMCWHEEDAETSLAYVGLIIDVIKRDIASISVSDNSNNSHAYSNYTHRKASGLLNFNEETFGTREFYAEVDGQTVTMKHNSGTTNFGKYANGSTYNYVLIKYTE